MFLIIKLKKASIWAAVFTLKIFPKMRMSEKCLKNKHNNNSDNPLTSRRSDGGGKNERFALV